MKKLNPEKLSVEFRGVTPTYPIIPRFYTLTHSDLTAELFLTIGRKYALDKLNPTRDEVLGEWRYIDNHYVYLAYCHVGYKYTEVVAAIRYKVFVKQLPLALEAIRYGDRELFKTYPELNNAEIFVHFLSSFPQFNKVESFGRMKDYA